jgi:hypothetical protein
MNISDYDIIIFSKLENLLALLIIDPLFLVMKPCIDYSTLT